LSAAANMTITAEARQELAKRLQEQYAEIRSWRKVAELCYPGVTFQTLNRIATSGGEWLPRDKKMLQALGLLQKREPRTKIQKAIVKMARNVKHPEKYQDPDIPEMERRIRKGN
jgi:hypothetical protein